MERKHPQSVCEDCPLYDERPYVGPTLRDNGVTIAILGEGPGRQEVTQEEYWVGAAGKLLFDSLIQVDIKREDCSLHNACQCYPPKRGKTNTPTDKEIELCSRDEDRLKNEILSQQPRLILALGNSAMVALFGSKGLGITKERRKLRKWHGIEVLPTVHPAAILRGGGAFADFAKDLEMIPDVLAGKVIEHVLPNVDILYKESEVRALLKRLAQDDITDITVDVETTGFDYFHDTCLCISLSVRDGKKAFVFAEELCTPEILNLLVDTPGLKWSYWNGMFDAQMFRSWLGRDDIPYDDDGMLMSYSLDERQGVHGLKYRASEDLGAPDYEAEVRKYLPTKGASYADIPKPVLYKYAGYDAAYEQQERRLLWSKMDSNQRMFYQDILMPGARLIMDMEREGMLIDRKALAKLRDDYKERLKKVEANMFETVGHEFNPKSPQQVSRILYEDLGLPRPRSQTVTATDKDCLKSNEQRHEFIPQLLQYREEHKLYSTYIVGLDAQVWSDGRVHASYLLHGSVSRTSCRNPNIQNIPREGPIKMCFPTPKGWEFFWPDFSQHEYRMVAVYSGDEWLLEVFSTTNEKGERRSLHKEMAIDVYGEGYSDEEYIWTKNINFGLLFGRTAYSLSFQLGKTPEECQELIDEMYGRMPRVRPWQESVLTAALRGEDLVSKLGRYRRFGLITPQNLKHTRNEIYNFYPQCTGSDTALRSMHDVWFDQGDPDWLRPCAFIHDGLGFYIKKGHRDRIPEMVRQLEETPQRMLNTDVPFAVEVKVGDVWGSLEELDLKTLTTASERAA